MAKLIRIHENPFYMIWLLYEPHCPSPTCMGGDKNKLYHMREKPGWLPPEVWNLRKEDEILYRCSHCGLVWFQPTFMRPGLDANPIGYYDDFDYPREFISLEVKHRIREQSTSRYWYGTGRKRSALLPPARGGVE